MKRIEKLKYLSSEDAWYKKLCLKLTEAEFDQLIEIIQDNDDLNNDQFTLLVNRYFLDKKNKPKNWTAMSDILLACRET